LPADGAHEQRAENLDRERKSVDMRKLKLLIRARGGKPRRVFSRLRLPRELFLVSVSHDRGSLQRRFPVIRLF